MAPGAQVRDAAVGEEREGRDRAHVAALAAAAVLDVEAGLGGDGVLEGAQAVGDDHEEVGGGGDLDGLLDAEVAPGAGAGALDAGLEEVAGVQRVSDGAVEGGVGGAVGVEVLAQGGEAVAARLGEGAAGDLEGADEGVGEHGQAEAQGLGGEVGEIGAGAVGEDDDVARRPEEVGEGGPQVGEGRLAADHGVIDAGEAAHDLGDAHAGIDEVLEHGARDHAAVGGEAEAHRADLDDAIVPMGDPGGLEVERHELLVVQWGGRQHGRGV